MQHIHTSHTHTSHTHTEPHTHNTNTLASLVPAHTTVQRAHTYADTLMLVGYGSVQEEVETVLTATRNRGCVVEYAHTILVAHVVNGLSYFPFITLSVISHPDVLVDQSCDCVVVAVCVCRRSSNEHQRVCVCVCGYVHVHDTHWCCLHITLHLLSPYVQWWGRRGETQPSLRMRGDHLTACTHT